MQHGLRVVSLWAEPIGPLREICEMRAIVGQANNTIGWVHSGFQIGQMLDV
jgi:hypothetical protein